MGLRAQAALDARAILENSGADGFGCPIVLTSPAGDELALVGQATDVAESIDPETGVSVTARRASVALALASLPVMPESAPDESERPWLVRFDDIAGNPTLWKVAEVKPDRAIGVVVLLLEGYRASAD
jgi:hypothetical protein